MTTKQGPITKATANTAKKADKLVADGVNTYTDAKDVATAKCDAAKKRITDTADAAKEKMAETHENARVYVQDNPEKSIGVAVGVGALIGAVITLILTRR